MIPDEKMHKVAAAHIPFARNAICAISALPCAYQVVDLIMRRMTNWGLVSVSLNNLNFKKFAFK